MFLEILISEKWFATVLFDQFRRDCCDSAGEVYLHLQTDYSKEKQSLEKRRHICDSEVSHLTSVKAFSPFGKQGNHLFPHHNEFGNFDFYCQFLYSLNLI